MNNFERRLVQEARALAEHLIAYAKDRKGEDQKAIAACQANLCRIYREEKTNANSDDSNGSRDSSTDRGNN